MTRIITSLLLTVVVTAALAAAESPKLIVAKFHADWCASCKAMGEVEKDLENKFDGKSVLFVTFDRTNNSSSHQSELLASGLGLAEVYKANQGTGFLLVLDADSKESKARLTRNHDFKEMTEAIEEAL